MKLIDEKLVEEAAEFYAKIETNYTGQINRNIGFKSGVDFAEQQLKQKMIEFAEWFFITTYKFTRPDLYSVVKWSGVDSSNLYTSEQLLEEFINQQK